ncbi:hypothetical protein SSPS47_26715 [Streptomyces sp. S4.7]|uniref:hypothetical protein n=1 Tax=Streptomyces sp. S4.7 TaxID=2705439 RepID=UPI0013970B21|nr:hypothetical protein [Streptomyces sp. S4.7]QHY98704.1 hypothetical protein SSPS47_26715 [Streptomyces sp. S4.7]
MIIHEELAGPALGGTTEAREGALTRLLRATGGPAPSVAAGIPPPRTEGAVDDLAVGIGRELFTPAHERLLRHHSALLHDRA